MVDFRHQQHSPSHLYHQHALFQPSDHLILANRSLPCSFIVRSYVIGRIIVESANIRFGLSNLYKRLTTHSWCLPTQNWHGPVPYAPVRTHWRRKLWFQKEDKKVLMLTFLRRCLQAAQATGLRGLPSVLRKASAQ